jgi:hypothetical protein
MGRRLNILAALMLGVAMMAMPLPTSAQDNAKTLTTMDFNIVGCMLDRLKEDEGGGHLPPTPGIIIIPNNIGFLHLLA